MFGVSFISKGNLSAFVQGLWIFVGSVIGTFPGESIAGHDVLDDYSEGETDQEGVLIDPLYCLQSKPLMAMLPII